RQGAPRRGPCATSRGGARQVGQDVDLPAGAARRGARVSSFVAAPGKAILSGEYAVLHGAPAIAVAVDRYVKVAPRDVGPDAPGPTPFVAAALRHAGHAPTPLHIDSSALYERDVKLGLGSSAAVTA